jgi:diaminopimelate decarboxylase
VTIAGPLCTGLDILAQDVPFGPPEVGELLAVLDAGAYGFTESMPLFLSRPLAAEVCL